MRGFQKTDISGICYVSDAAINNAEAIFNGQFPNFSSLVDLISITQACVMNESLIVSPMAISRSTLLDKLDFVETFKVETYEKEGEEIHNIIPPRSLPSLEGDSISIDLNEEGELTTNTVQGDLYLASTWSVMLAEDPVLGRLFAPEQSINDSPIGESYLLKLSAFILWLQADRGLLKFENEEARTIMLEQSETHLKLYRSLTKRLLDIRDIYGLDYVCSVIEQPIFSLSLSKELISPLEYLSKYDKKIHEAISSSRTSSLEYWKIPSIGAAVLAKARTLKDLPKEIQKARSLLLKARMNIRDKNIELLSYERELEFGNDRHFREIDRLKITLQRSIQAFGEDTVYRPELESFPISERIWCLPKLLSSILGSINSPEKALEEISEMPYLKRKSYLRYVPGLTSASHYVKKTRNPMMSHLIETILNSSWEAANNHRQILEWSTDLTNRCTDLRSIKDIGDKSLITLDVENNPSIDIKESDFWFLVASNEQVRDAFLYGNSRGQPA